MKRKLLILSLLLSVFGNSNMFAQTVIDLRHNSMKVGDVVEKYKIMTDDVWNLQQAEKCSDAVLDSYEGFKTDTITRLFNGMRKYYVYRSDSLLYVGSENPLQKESLYIPETSCVFPMSLGDKHTGTFAGIIDYCDKMRFHKYGTYTVHADSVGALALPDGTLVGDVLQVCFRRHYIYEQLRLDSQVCLPACSEVEILQRIAAGDNVYTEIEKELYAKGYCYPIVKDFLLYDPMGEPCARETYYYPLSGQETLPLDEANMQARRERHDMEGNGDAKDKDNVLSFVRQDAATMTVVFDSKGYLAVYPSVGTIRCKFLLSDSKGIVCRVKEFTLGTSAADAVGLPYSGLRHGQYIVSIVIGNETYTTNLII